MSTDFQRQIEGLERRLANLERAAMREDPPPDAGAEDYSVAVAHDSDTSSWVISTTVPVPFGEVDNTELHVPDSASGYTCAGWYLYRHNAHNDWLWRWVLFSGGAIVSTDYPWGTGPLSTHLGVRNGGGNLIEDGWYHKEHPSVFVPIAVFHFSGTGTERPAISVASIAGIALQFACLRLPPCFWETAAGALRLTIDYNASFLNAFGQAALFQYSGGGSYYEHAGTTIGFNVDVDDNLMTLGPADGAVAVRLGRLHSANGLITRWWPAHHVSIFPVEEPTP